MTTIQQVHYSLGHKETQNILECFEFLHHHARFEMWHKRDAYRTANLIVMCVLDESGARILANPNVPESLKIPHDGLGYDHASVGMFQQQVPMWGNAADCMDPKSSARKFVRRLQEKELTVAGSAPWHEAVQAVQVSAYADGSNYARFYDMAKTFTAKHWDAEHMKGR